MLPKSVVAKHVQEGTIRQYSIPKFIWKSKNKLHLSER